MRKLLSVVSVYSVILLAVFSLATWRLQAQGEQTGAQATATTQPTASPAASPAPVRPNFSLSTNRAYGTGEKTRIYVNYQGIDAVDFRVYKVKDPFKFFKQLANPHQIGKDDREFVSEVTETQQRKPSFLEKLREFKSTIAYSFKSYFRTQLRRDSRAAFNDKFRSGERLPINVASYAQMPLLNPDQLEDSFRQVLTPLDNRWDTRMVTLGQKTPGVYLVEAVNNGLRAYTIAVVTDLTMISKISRNGEVMVYTVDRKSGEPRDDAMVQIVKGRKLLATGKTDKNGLLRVTVKPGKEADNTDNAAEPPPDQDVSPSDYLILVNRKDDFAVSDLNSYLFNDIGEGGEEEALARNLSSYIYTDRPVYRPEQKAYFKGILRRKAETGYQMLESRIVHVTVSNPEGNEIYQRDLTLSPRGTFSGEADIAANAPLGGYSIVVHLNGIEAARGFFEVAEYKKPEYKVKVSTPKNFVAAGEKTKYTVEAKYFFGAPVKNAEVKYYIYRSTYYPWWWANDDDEMDSEESDDSEGGYGFGNDMVKEGEGRLNEAGQLEIPFDVPQPGKDETRDFSYRIEVTVTDSARREIEGKASFVGTRGNIVINADAERYVYLVNDTARVKIKASDYDGKPVSTKVKLTFLEVKYEKTEVKEENYMRTKWERKTRELSSGEVQTNGQGEANYDYKVPVIGSIAIEAIVNENGKQVKSAAGSIYVTDRNNSWADAAVRDSEAIKLVPDKKAYKPGETARVLAMLPTNKAHLLVTTELDRVLETRHVYAEGRTVIIDLPIQESFAPNIYLSIAYVRDGQMYEHSKSISVPAANKYLNIELMPDKREYKPRDPASYTV
ncbi:MAG: MG2 domain-containing protein, partial [Acidobacteriota bacterium]|nr:MG2 domain-containing protein [Acidobacteriota bacterium]